MRKINFAQQYDADKLYYYDTDVLTIEVSRLGVCQLPVMLGS